MHKENLFSGKLIKIQRDQEVQRGPLPPVEIKDPVKSLVTGSLSYFPYEANGLVQPDLTKSQYLKS